MFSSQLQETQGTNKKLELIISQLEAVRRADTTPSLLPSPKFMASSAQGPVALYETGQSSNSRMQVTPVATPTSYPVEEDSNFLPFSHQSSPLHTNPMSTVPLISNTPLVSNIPLPTVTLPHNNTPMLPLPIQNTVATMTLSLIFSKPKSSFQNSMVLTPGVCYENVSSSEIYQISTKIR